MVNNTVDNCEQLPNFAMYVCVPFMSVSGVHEWKKYYDILFYGTTKKHDFFL